MSQPTETDSLPGHLGDLDWNNDQFWAVDDINLEIDQLISEMLETEKANFNSRHTVYTFINDKFETFVQAVADTAGIYLSSSTDTVMAALEVRDASESHIEGSLKQSWPISAEPDAIMISRHGHEDDDDAYSHGGSEDQLQNKFSAEWKQLEDKFPVGNHVLFPNKCIYAKDGLFWELTLLCLDIWAAAIPHQLAMFDDPPMSNMFTKSHVIKPTRPGPYASPELQVAYNCYLQGRDYVGPPVTVQQNTTGLPVQQNATVPSMALMMAGVPGLPGPYHFPPRYPPFYPPAQAPPYYPPPLPYPYPYYSGFPLQPLPNTPPSGPGPIVLQDV
ncbi:hypothetical protein JVU11DRAFT_1094 [Chiua virens]|nr:hypothetical protein JVU11DRAFT_1094 [Chiua virens]